MKLKLKRFEDIGDRFYKENKKREAVHFYDNALFFVEDDENARARINRKILATYATDKNDIRKEFEIAFYCP